MLGAIALAFFVFGSPATKAAPAIVQFEDEQVLRAGGDGFIESIHVNDGEAVKQGQLLVTLRNDELQNEVDNLKRLVTESEIQYRIHTRKDEKAEAQTVLNKKSSLAKQLREKSEQLSHLKILAPFEGFVFKRELSNQIGRYVRHGDEVLNVGRTQSRKLIVSIDQEDLDSIRENRDSDMRVLMPGLPVFKASVQTVNERASDRPKYPAICASYGGPLPVEPLPSEDESTDREVEKFRLLAPRFDVELAVNSELGPQLQCGQVGRAFFATKRQSLGAFLYLETQRWFERQFQQAMLTR